MDLHYLNAYFPKIFHKYILNNASGVLDQPCLETKQVKVKLFYRSKALDFSREIKVPH